MNQNENDLSSINNNELPTNEQLVDDSNKEVVPEKKEFSLEDNIINIEIPEDVLKSAETIVEQVDNVTPIEPVPTIEISKEEIKPERSVMVEKKAEDTTNNSKGALPVFIIFGLFILVIIAFPYISNYLEEKEQLKKDEEFEQYKDSLNKTPISTPTTDTTNTFEELYNSCGTEEIFTNITINYTLLENQCFKVNLNNTKNFIKYVPAINESENWSIYLGEKEIYTLSKTSTNTIGSINIVNNTVELKEIDNLGNIVNTHSFDINGNKINNQPVSEQ